MPADEYLAAAIQMNSGPDKAKNLAACQTLIQSAVDSGAQLVVLPELFNCIDEFPSILQQAESIPGETSRQLCEWASRFGIHLCAGSICESSDIADRAYNTSLIIDPQGNILARYRKAHLFQLDHPEHVSVDESRFFLHGDAPTVCSTDVGQLGMSICFDLRFGEFYRELNQRGAQLVLVPSAFTKVTGEAHWEVLLRSRAIETQSYVIAANQIGQHGPFESYGHSMIIDPWGKLLSIAPSEDPTVGSIALANISLNELSSVRARIPMEAARRGANKK